MEQRAAYWSSQWKSHWFQELQGNRRSQEEKICLNINKVGGVHPSASAVLSDCVSGLESSPRPVEQSLSNKPGNTWILTYLRGGISRSRWRIHFPVNVAAQDFSYVSTLPYADLTKTWLWRAKLKKNALWSTFKGECLHSLRVEKNCFEVQLTCSSKDTEDNDRPGYKLEKDLHTGEKISTVLSPLLTIQNRELQVGGEKEKIHERPIKTIQKEKANWRTEIHSAWLTIWNAMIKFSKTA